MKTTKKRNGRLVFGKGVNKEMEFYLLDLERTIGFSRPFFWKGSKHGYTSSLEFAGLYSKKLAEKIVAEDRDNTTVLIPQEMVFKILGKDLKPHEGTINTY